MRIFLRKSLYLLAALYFISVPALAADDDDTDLLFGEEEPQITPPSSNILRPKFNIPVPTEQPEEKMYGGFIETQPQQPQEKAQTPQAPAKKKTQKAKPAKRSQPQIDTVTKAKNGLEISTEEMENWLKKTADVNTCYDNGKTMLIFMAAKSANLEALRLLLEYGADVQTPCTPRYEALFVATANNPNAEVVDILINSGANLVEKDDEGNSALLLAATYNSSPKVLEMLIDYGLKLEEKNNLGFDALMLAAWQNRHLSILQTIIDNEANVNAADKNGRTALMAAAIRGSNPIMQYLIKRGADFKAVDKQGISVLDYHNKRKYLETLSYEDAPYDTPSERLQKQFDFIAQNHLKYNNMLKSGIFSATPDEDVAEAIANLADIDIPDNNGCTTLINAIRNQNTASVIEKLLAAKADTNIGCLGAKTPLMFLSARAEEDIPDSPDSPINLARLLITNGAGINYQDEEGLTALIYALALNADINFINTLLAQGADTNLIDNNGNTALWAAIKTNRSADIITLLLQNGANPNYAPAGQETPLWYALKNNMEPAAVALLQGGADTTITDNAGIYPLWYAFEHGGTAELLESIIRAQQNLNIKNTAGDTPLLYALKNEFPTTLVKLMLENGADPKIEDADGHNAMDILQNSRFFDAAVQRRTREQVLNNSD